MRIPDFFGDPVAANKMPQEWYARKAEAVWHQLGHTQVRFWTERVKQYHPKPIIRESDGYVLKPPGWTEEVEIRSNLVNGLPPRRVAVAA